MDKRRVIFAGLLALILALSVGVANAGKEPAVPPPLAEVQPSEPTQGNRTVEGLIQEFLQTHAQAEPQCPRVSTPPGSDVLNVHCTLGPPADYFAEGKVLGMTDAEARAYAAKAEADQRAMLSRMHSTLPPPPGVPR